MNILSDIAMAFGACIGIYFIIRALREPQPPTREPGLRPPVNTTSMDEVINKAVGGLLTLCGIGMALGMAFGILYLFVRVIHWMWYQ